MCLQTVSSAVVLVEVLVVRDFLNASAGVRRGTGFVVDFKCGLILTSRSVSPPGPSRLRVTFVGTLNLEEVPAEVVYVDPLHDYAFIRFHHKDLRKTPAAEIALDDAGCLPGEDIWVLGSTGLEPPQVLPGAQGQLVSPPLPLFSPQGLFQRRGLGVHILTLLRQEFCTPSSFIHPPPPPGRVFSGVRGWVGVCKFSPLKEL